VDLGKAMIVAGIGCQKGSSGAAVTAAIRHALKAHGLARDLLDKLATGEIKRDEPGIWEAGEELKLTLEIIGKEALARASARCLTHSGKSVEVTGLASFSEAAALAAAGDGSKLLGPRIAHDGVTCALARSEGDA
jgi:cobalt-precorrin 5A hydrolase